MKILLVDDDPIAHLINEKLISTAIDNPNLEIISFHKANEALAYNLQYLRSNSRENLYIFLDLNMPQFNGWDFLDVIEKFNDHKISIFILTSSIRKKDRAKAAKYKSVKAYLVKPLSIPLITKIFKQELA